MKFHILLLRRLKPLNKWKNSSYCFFAKVLTYILNIYGRSCHNWNRPKIFWHKPAILKLQVLRRQLSDDKGRRTHILCCVQRRTALFGTDRECLCLHYPTVQNYPRFRLESWKRSIIGHPNTRSLVRDISPPIVL